MRNAPFATRRARDVNHGDRTPLRGAESKTLAWISVEDAQAFTVYATARVRPATARVVPIVAMEWGHGGASLVGEYPVIRRLRVPVVASMVKLSGRLVDVATGKAPAATVSAEISAAIVPGSDGQTLHTTSWIGQTGAEGLAASGPQRVFTVDGYNGGLQRPECWVMVFDDVTTARARRNGAGDGTAGGHLSADLPPTCVRHARLRARRVLGRQLDSARPHVRGGRLVAGRHGGAPVSPEQIARYRTKAATAAAAWQEVLGEAPTRVALILAMAVADLETGLERHQAARGATSTTGVAVHKRTLSAGGARRFFWVTASIPRGNDVLATARGLLAPTQAPDELLIIDQSPVGPYFVWIWAFPTATSTGAAK